jgi:6-phosphogluconate dehydrogenase
MSNEEMAHVFAEWNTKGDILESFLIEITDKILRKKDDVASGGSASSDAYVVDKIKDKTGMKGTGRWTVQEAAEHSVAASIIATSLDARYLSARYEERQIAATVLQGPTGSSVPVVDKEQLLADLKAALYCAKVTSYAQGLQIIQAASLKNDWKIDLGLCARMWRGGCIIRASLLSKISLALEINPSLSNLLLDPTFAAEINDRQMAWRRVVTLGIASGISCPALSAALTYYDQYRRGRLPANLIQAQRDFFGGHTYERLDSEPGKSFHCLWDDAHKDIGDVAGRTAGEM